MVYGLWRLMALNAQQCTQTDSIMQRVHFETKTKDKHMFHRTHILMVLGGYATRYCADCVGHILGIIELAATSETAHVFCDELDRWRRRRCEPRACTKGHVQENSHVHDHICRFFNCAPQLTQNTFHLLALMFFKKKTDSSVQTPMERPAICV